MTKALHITKEKKDDRFLSEREAAMVAQDRIIKDSLSLFKHKFIVMSGKGGVGKTSVAANLAMALSNLNFCEKKFRNFSKYSCP